MTTMERRRKIQEHNYDAHFYVAPLHD